MADYSRIPENTIRLHRWLIIFAVICALLYLAPFFWNCQFHDDGRIDEYSAVLGIETIGAILMILLTPPFVFFAMNPYKSIGDTPYKRLAFLFGSILAISHIVTPFAYYSIKDMNDKLAEDAFNPSNGYQAHAASVPYIVVNWEIVISLAILGFILLIIVWIANAPEFQLGSKHMKKKRAGISMEDMDNPWKVIYKQTLVLYPEIATQLNLSEVPSEQANGTPVITENIDEEAKCPHCSYEFTARYQGDPSNEIEVTCPRCNHNYPAKVQSDYSLKPRI